MQVAPDDDLAAAVTRLMEGGLPPTGYRAELLRHRAAGRSLRNYAMLTECPNVAAWLTAHERFWSRHYWYARFTREWQATEGYDAGLEKSQFNLLEAGVEHGGVALDPLPEVDTAVERDAGIRPR